jgi:glycine cleavage system H protein
MSKTKNKKTLRVAQFTRRQFLQRAGMVAGGAAVFSITLTAACKSSKATSAKTTTDVKPNTSTTSVPQTSASTTPSSAIPNSSFIEPSSTGSTSTTPPISTTGLNSYIYVPPAVTPQMIMVPGTTCVVANDRLYSPDHIWVKSLSPSIAVIGITKILEEIIYEPFKISMPKTGNTLACDLAFGSIEGYKMVSDLISPVSGQVIQINDFLNLLMNQGKVLEPIINDTYNTGWMLVVKLSNLEELKTLLSAQNYRDLVTK